MFTQALSMPLSLRSTGTYFMYNYSVKACTSFSFFNFNILTDFLRMNEDISATSQKL